MTDQPHFNARPENLHALRHGAYSERKIRPLARNKKRAWLRRTGVTASALTGAQSSHLNRWARLEAMCDLAQRWLDENGGMIRDDGEAQSIVKVIVSVENAARLAMQALDAALQRTGQTSPLPALEGEGRRLRLEAEKRIHAVQ